MVRANCGEPVPTLDQLAQDWKVIRTPVASSAHVDSVERFRRLHMYDVGAVPIDDIATAQVERARIEYLKTYKPASANHWLRILKLLTLWAVKRKILATSLWKVSTLKVQKRPRAVLPLDVAQAWFDAVDTATRRAPAIATAVRLMFGLGLREGECLTARWKWINWERATYTPGETKVREADPGASVAAGAPGADAQG